MTFSFACFFKICSNFGFFFLVLLCFLSALPNQLYGGSKFIFFLTLQEKVIIFFFYFFWRKPRSLSFFSKNRRFSEQQYLKTKFLQKQKNSFEKIALNLYQKISKNKGNSFEQTIPPAYIPQICQKTKVIHLRLRYTAPEIGGCDPSVNRFFASVPIFFGHDNQAL